MYTAQPKKMLIINILDILRKYTDENHRLSQKDIVDILKTEYNMTVDRKSVKRNLMNLIDFGYEIEYSESIRMVKNSKTGEFEESYILSDFYLLRDFTDSELRLLIDSLLFSKHIPYNQCKELIEKLEGLSNKYFESKVKHIKTLQNNSNENKQLFYTIDILDEAISKGLKVKFFYNEYGTDKKLHHRKNNEGNDREYIINPYQIVATNSRYYLICNYDKYDNVAYYRLDRISDIELLNEPIKPKEKVKGLENGLNLSKIMNEHIYMFNGNTINCKFISNKSIINDLIDYFGKDIKITDETDSEITVSVTVNEKDMHLWALQYSTQIKVIEPKELAENIKSDIMKAAEMYSK